MKMTTAMMTMRMPCKKSVQATDLKPPILTRMMANSENATMITVLSMPKRVENRAMAPLYWETMSRM